MAPYRSCHGNNNMSVPRRRYGTPRGAPWNQQQQEGPSMETTPPAQRAGIAIVSSLSTSKPAVYSQRITSNSVKKRTDTPPSHKDVSISSQISFTALQETRDESLPHSPPLSPSLYIQQELHVVSLSADQITSTHSHTFVPNTDVLVSHSDPHTHVLSQTPRSHSDPHTSCPRSHTSDLHSHSDPQLLTNGIQENTYTDETHSRSNKSHSYTDETHSHTDEPGKLFMYKNDNLIFCFSYSTSQ